MNYQDFWIGSHIIWMNRYHTSPHPLAQTPESGHISSKEQLIKDYPDHCKGIGRFPGTYKMHLKKDAKPVIHPQGKWPIAMQSKLKTKLNQIEKDGIIAKVTEPTDWVKSLACSWKPKEDI